MFKNTYQSGLLTIFYSCGSNPLAIWDMEVRNGHIKRLTDDEVKSIVLEIVGTNVATTYITCPKRNQVLGIRLPFLVMIVKNLKRYFSFEITILDDKNVRRRFSISNFQSTTKIKPFCTSMPIGLSGGWNQIQFNLADFTKRAYGTQFIETLRVQVHANTRIRRIYFCERLYGEDELPQDYKLYLPLDRKQKKGKTEKEPAQAAKPSAAPPPTPPTETETAKKEGPPQAPSEPIKQEPPDAPKTEKPAPIKEEVIEDIKQEEAAVEDTTVTEPPASEPLADENPPETNLEEESYPSEANLEEESYPPETNLEEESYPPEANLEEES